MKELHPFTDAMASLFSAIKFRDNFNAPVLIIPNPEHFNLINQVEIWLGWEKGSITLNPQKIAPTELAGMIYTKKESASILYCLQDFTVCWRRLVIAKELCHVIYDALDYSKIPFDADSVIDGVVYDTFVYNPDCIRGKMEIIAHILAPHLLIPWWEHDEVKNSKDTNWNLANKYRVPEKTIEEFKDGKHEYIANQIKQSFSRLAQTDTCTA